MIVRTELQNGIVAFSQNPLKGFRNSKSTTVSLVEALGELHQISETRHDPYQVKDADEYEQIVSGDHEDFEVVEKSEWEQDSKYQWRSIVVKHKKTGLHYEGYESRSGSPFTDWHYEYDDSPLSPVKRTVKVIETWE